MSRDVELVLSSAEYFGQSKATARAVVKSVAEATRTWRDVAKAAGARVREIDRMASAFEHDDLNRALKL